jgi:hypothetical protein
LDHPPSIQPPSATICTEDLAARNKALHSKERTHIEPWLKALAARLVGESWIALATTAKHPSMEMQTAYLQRRVQNTWLLHQWPAIEKKLAKKPSDDQLALYLALGFSQATTTWQWPATPRWIEIIDAAPPAHWLPRSQYHLCWLLYDPENETHHRALQQALGEGLEDQARPTIAERLGALFPPR